MASMKASTPAAPPRVPADLRKAFAADPQAKARWSELTPIARRDFIGWIDSAKQAVTRERRIERTCSMLVAGKRRPCCYAVVPFDLYTALSATPKAKAHWRRLSSDARRDVIEWIAAAKPSESRERRVEKACALLAAGKQCP